MATQAPAGRRTPPSLEALGLVTLLALLVFGAACAATTASFDERHAERREHLFHASPDEVWRAARAALAESERHLTSEAPEAGEMTAFLRRRAAPSLRRDALVDELREISRFDSALTRGLEDVSELQVRYFLDVEPAPDERSVVKVAAEIDAVDRSQVIAASGFPTVVPRHFRLPSRGVLERDLLREIAGRIYLGEEQLHYTGELGRD